MATLAIPFEKIEGNLNFVSSGATVSREDGFLYRALVRFAVAAVLHRTIKLQGSLVSVLHEACGKLTVQQYETIAGKLDSLVPQIREVIEQTRGYKVIFNHDSVRRMEIQCERLDSLAETYHMNADAAISAYVGELMMVADTEDTGESWRDFVASLHD